ncbi:uncharacterized protein SOCEGT47_055250 [Sorangium cellulosum]|uniref:Transposase n=1 Tax=Sorangium cellulosum TaxID=56 RepID=A0A4P2Q689_SORCE|nr:hypothetical protein [Sorangium cellulosum]AUX24984.1 uncharacterized protein SOCEGT47_055250 [Sorangium cellulosum]
MAKDEPSATDPFLDEVVERALAPYRGVAQPELLEIMRELLVEALTEDEVGRDLVERARPRAAPLGSGVQARDGGAEPGRKAGGGEHG